MQRSYANPQEIDKDPFEEIGKARETIFTPKCNGRREVFKLIYKTHNVSCPRCFSVVQCKSY